jgi:ABC-2 type transport system permease protein
VNGILLVVRRELALQLRSKGFLISVLVTMLIVVAVVGVPRLLDQQDSYRVGLVGGASQDLGAPLSALAEQSGVALTTSAPTDEGAARAALEEDELDAAVVDGRVVLSDDVLDPGLSGLLQNAHAELELTDRLAALNLSPDQISQALGVAPLEEIALAGDAQGEGARQQVALLIMLGLLFLFMTTTVGVGAGVVEEKGSRIVEILLVALKPWQLLTGKLIAFGVLGLIQLVALVAAGLGAAWAFGITGDLPPGMAQIVAATVLAYVLGFLFFGAMAAALASLVSRQEETNGALAPLTAAILLSYLAAFVVVAVPDETAARVVALLPPISSIALPVQVAAGIATTWEVVIAIVLMVLAIVAIVALAGRIYERSVLRAGSRIKLAEAIRGRS